MDRVFYRAQALNPSGKTRFCNLQYKPRNEVNNIFLLYQEDANQKKLLNFAGYTVTYTFTNHSAPTQIY